MLTGFWAIFFVARPKEGISALQRQRDTGIGSYGTAWALLHRLGSALRDRTRAACRLSGLVEVDESEGGGPEPGRRGGAARCCTRASWPWVQGHAARSSEILPWAHPIFGNLKRWLRGTFHGVSGKHLPRYLDEFVYRFDRRWREGELFGFVRKRAARGEPMPYHRRVAEAAA